MVNLMTLFTTFTESIIGYETPSTADGMIIEWFNHGFGTSGTETSRRGNLILIFLSLILATFFGGVIGFQREINGHAAGFRTHMLIAIGSAVIMIISIYGIPDSASRDPMRLAAAGVTGIGFLGAGSIIQNGFNVKGLTTAASIWVTMSIGMASGAGYFLVATIATIFALICLSLFRKVEVFASRRNSNVLLVVDGSVPVLTKLLDVSEKMGITIKDISSSLIRENDKQMVRVVFKIACIDQDKINSYLDELKVVFTPIELKILS
jgi:putative Mg2+ transporter-C (MgtC) family protein